MRTLFTAVSALAVMSLSSFGAIITDAQVQSNFSGYYSGPVTIGAHAFDYTGQATLSSITAMEFKLTVSDGDTGIGDIDYNQISLFLDGIDTGLKLNGLRSGFLDDGVYVFVPTNVSAILAALNADNKLVATWVDSSPGDNSIWVANVVNRFPRATMLTIIGAEAGVPEPGTYAMLGLGLAALAAWRRKAVVVQ